VPLVLLDELGVLEVLLGEVGRHLGDEESGDGEPREEGPVAPPLPAEEDRPRVERLHLLGLRLRLRLRLLAISFLPPPPPASLLVRFEGRMGISFALLSWMLLLCSPSPSWRRCADLLGLGLEWAVVGGRLGPVACWAGNRRNFFSCLDNGPFGCLEQKPSLV